MHSARFTLPRTSLVVAVLARCLQPPKAEAEDRLEYRFENYAEDDHRMHIQTHAVGFDAELFSRIAAKGLFVYDSISGATPTGEPPPSGGTVAAIGRYLP